MDNSIEQTVGMHLGDKKVFICRLDEAGEVTEQTSVTNNAESILEYFERFERPAMTTVAMEVGTHSPWISDVLLRMGFVVLVGNVRKMRAIWDTDYKTDIRDAEMIARMARFDSKLLYPIEHRGAQAQADLAVIKCRDTLVQSRTSLINTVRGMMKSAGVKLPTCSTPSFASQAAAHIPESYWTAMSPLLDTIGGLTQKIRQCDRQLIQIAKDRYPETERLTQIAGVGPLISLAFVLTIEQPNRFKKCRDVGAYLGLTPKKDQSGGVDKQLRITKAGNVYMRQLLVNAANYIMGVHGPDCELRRFGLRKAGDKNKIQRRKAKVAVARKLAVLMLHLWKNDQHYDPLFHQNQKLNNAA